MNTDHLAELVVPLIASAGLELYDVEERGATVRVSVMGNQGVPSGALERLAREISLTLDEADPIAGSYTLEVSTRGIERNLRSRAHFEGAVGEIITIKTTPGPRGRIRYRGELSAVEVGRIVVLDEKVGQVELTLDQVESARTVFEWGAESKPGSATSPNTTARGGRQR